MKELKLKRIRIENFKCFDEMEIKFSGKTTLDGMNASGKTTVMDAYFWCLFGTDADGNTKFDIRPMDSNGNTIDNTVISVAIEVEIDGKGVCFKRSSKQNFVKKRGSDNPVFQGNVGEYEIDGYPCSEAEYKNAVAEIVDQKVFKILTNPMFFASLPWKEQRSLILSAIDIGTDRQIAEQIGGFDEILEELDKAPDTDSIRTKYAKTLKELKQKQSEIPTRIDEASKRIVDYDRTVLLSEKQTLEAEIDDLQVQKVTGDKSSKEAALKAEIASESAKARQISAESYAFLNEKRSHIRSVMTGLMVKSDREVEIERSIEEYKSQMSVHDATIRGANMDLNEANEAGKKLNEKWKTIKARVFDESAEVCPTCGRPFDSSDVEQHRKAFEDGKEKQLAELKSQAERLQKQKADATTAISEAEAAVNSIGAEVEKLEAELARLKADREDNYAGCKRELDALPTVIEPTSEEQQIAERIKALQAELNALSDDGNALLIDGEIADRKATLASVNEKLALLAENDRINERIEELRVELADVAQKILECEKVIFLVEGFVRAKMEYISDMITEKFGGVSFKLFDTQINGGMKETCEISYKGIPYSELNNGHRIVAGLLVINALQDVFGIQVPTWLDNSESVNSFNLPTMRNQMILLRVSENRGLIVIEG